MMRSVTITRLIAFSIFATICLYQCYSIIFSYLQYPQIIDIHDVLPELNQTFPGVTICNNNRFSLKKILNRNPLIRDAIMGKYPALSNADRYAFVDGAKFMKFRDFIAETYKKFNYSPIAHPRMSDRYTLFPNSRDFIRQASCALSLNSPVYCEQLAHIESIQDRYCVSLVHQGVLHNYNYHRATRNQSMATRDHFHSREVMRIVVDFEPEDYADLKRQIGARLTITANTHVASASDKDFFIERGFRYEFNLDRQDTVFKEDCFDYEGKNREKFRDSINPRVPLHSETCIQNCIVKNILHLSNCWPPTMPYFRNESLDPNETIEQCGWFREAQYFILYRDILISDTNKSKEEEDLSKLYRKDMRIYTKVRRHCRAQCRLSCVITQFSITKTQSKMPSQVQQALDKTGNSRIQNFCCSTISVKYSRFHYNVLEYVPKYDLADTIGNVGGLLAVWLGLSVVSIYNAIMKLIELCNRRRSRCKIRTRVPNLRSLTSVGKILHM